MKPKLVTICVLIIGIAMLVPISMAHAQFPLSPEDEKITNALGYLLSCEEDGGFDDLRTTNWVVIAIESVGEDLHNWNGKSPIDYMREHANDLENESNPATAHERFVLAVVASGEDPRNFYGVNYVEEVKAFYNSSNNQIGEPSFLTDDLWGVLALVACNESGIEVNDSVNYIKVHQNTDGGWGWAVGGESSPSETAAAIQALIAAGENLNSTIIQDAIVYLKNNQRDDGGFSWKAGYNSDVESDSSVIQAIVTCGQNPTKGEWVKNNSNPIEHLLGLQQEDGHFKNDIDYDYTPVWQTTQAIPALLGKPYPIASTPTNIVTVSVRIEGEKKGIWDGYVSFSNSTIIDTNGTEHFIPYPTVLGALDRSSVRGGFSYEVENESTLKITSIDNETGNWRYLVNYTQPSVDYALKINDDVLWYSAGVEPLKITLDQTRVMTGEAFNVTVASFSTTWNPVSNATIYVNSSNHTITGETDTNGNATICIDHAGNYLVYAEKDGYIRSERKSVEVVEYEPVAVNVRIEGEDVTIWTGKVNFSNSTITDVDGKEHYLPYPSALGALDEASKAGNFSYEVADMGWGLMVTSIGGEAYNPVTWDPSWLYRVDYYSPMVGYTDFIINVTEPPSTPHDEVLWYYGSWTEIPLKITLAKASVKVNEQFSATVEAYNDTSGVWDSVDNATVHVDGFNYTTNINGSAVLSILNDGVYTIYAEKEGVIRSERETVTVGGRDDGNGGGGGDGGVELIKLDICHAYRLPGDIYHGYIDFFDGMTVLDALKKANESKGFGYEYEAGYVSSIAGYKEKSEGPISGWMYWVNYPEEKEPNIPCNEYQLRSGDKVIWYWVTKPNTVPPTTTSGDRGGPESVISPPPTPTPTPAPTKIAEETKTIELIEVGGNASLTFNKTEITRVVINANSTIRTAEITVEQLEKPLNITNVSGIPYCYFNVTTTNLTDTNMTNATIEFKVNKTWINERNMDEATITLNRYSDMNNNWSALPTSKIEEDTTSLYFASETPGFSLFAISGHEKPAYLATGAETEAGTKPPMSEATAAPNPAPAPRAIPTSASVPKIPMSLIVIIIAIVAIAGMIIAVLKRK
jgi:PGF-pre-PGF domain-containing protein